MVGRRGPRAGHHLARGDRARVSQDPGHAGRAEAPRPRRACTTTGTTRTPAPSSRSGPRTGRRVTPFLSSVDNGWLAAALRVVQGAIPQLRAKAGRILSAMNFGFYYNPDATTPIGTRGLIRGGFWDTAPPGCSVPAPANGVWFTCNHYDITVTEPRIATYLGIGAGQIPPAAYFDTMRTLPDNCDYSWQEMQPSGFTATHLGVPVYEGSYRYRGITFVPSWGGDMFEALMPDLFVPETHVGPEQLGPQPPGHRGRADRARPERRRVRLLGLLARVQPGRRVRRRRASTRWAWTPTATRPTCRAASTTPGSATAARPVRPPSTATAWSPRTPRSWPCPTRAGPAIANLAKMKKQLRRVRAGRLLRRGRTCGTGTVAKRYLSLDQAMIMGAVGQRPGPRRAAPGVRDAAVRAGGPAAAGAGDVQRAGPPATCRSCAGPVDDGVLRGRRPGTAGPR